MGGGGGKGGSSETVVRLPPAIEQAAKENLNVADEVAAIGYMPYQGPTVAALSPQQYGMMANTGSAAQAFGLAAPGGQPTPPGIDPYTGLPMPQRFGGGVMGYSPHGLYEQAINQIPAAQRAFIQSFVVDPNTGAPPVNPSVPQPQYRPSAGQLAQYGASPQVIAQQQAQEQAAAQAAAQQAAAQAPAAPAYGSAQWYMQNYGYVPGAGSER